MNNKELQDCAVNFVENYYEVYNQNPALVQALYDKQAFVTWPDGKGSNTTVHTNALKNLFGKSAISYFKMEDFCAQQCAEGILFVAKGACGLSPSKLKSYYVQSFYLREVDDSFSILNDIVLIPEERAEHLTCTKPTKLTSKSSSCVKDVTTTSTELSSKGQPEKAEHLTCTNPTKLPSKPSSSVKNVNTTFTELTSKAHPEHQIATSRSGRKLRPPKQYLNSEYELGAKFKGCVSTHKPNVPAGVIAKESTLEFLDNEYDLAEKSKPCAELNSKDCTLGAEIPSQAQNDLKHTVCVVYDEAMLQHVESISPGADPSPEVPGRLTSIYNKFEGDGLLARCDVLRPDPATKAEIELVHADRYVNFISKFPATTRKDISEFIGSETENIYVSKGTKEACFLACGSVIKACTSVAEGKHTRAFCLVRPPGHHATRDKAAGFCFFNNIALGAQFLLTNFLSIKKILVVDFDVHHGDGTQSIFYGNPNVLVINIHSSEVKYPKNKEGTRSFEGADGGLGFNVNIPLDGQYGDADLLYAIDEVVIPLAKEFSPDIIMISAGYDAAKGDSVGGRLVTQVGYYAATAKLATHGTGRVIMVLEGGYSLPVIAKCAAHSLRALLGDEVPVQVKKRPLATTKFIITQVRNAMSFYWDVFKEVPVPNA